jgi:hypothetical protein
MEFLTALLGLIREPWVLPLALIAAIAILQIERSWVRARRRAGFQSSPLAHLLDALVALLGLLAAAAAARALLAGQADRLAAAAAPLTWAAGLILILVVGLTLIRRFAPAPSTPER